MKLYYITYQDFPSNKANSQQTITSCKYFAKNNVDVTLFFPLRSQLSSDNLSIIKDFYELNEVNFKIVGLKHFFKFEKYLIFKKFYFQLTQFIWSIKSVNYILNNYQKPDYVFTRSDWVFLYLAIRNFSVVFECHQLTFTRKLIMKLASFKKNTYFIFMNELLQKDSKINNLNNVLIQSNGFDEDYFNKNIQKIDNKVIFSGNLLRDGETRGVEFLINCFNDLRLKDLELFIIGQANPQYIASLKKLIKTNNIKILGYLKKSLAIKEVQSATIGILQNSNSSSHSIFHTDPLKYYEYSYANLKIIAPSFISHKNLNKYNNIYFYDYGDVNNFVEIIMKAHSEVNHISKNITIQTVDNRIKNIITFITK